MKTTASQSTTPVAYDTQLRQAELLLVQPEPLERRRHDDADERDQCDGESPHEPDLAPRAVRDRVGAEVSGRTSTATTTSSKKPCRAYSAYVNPTRCSTSPLPAEEKAELHEHEGEEEKVDRAERNRDFGRTDRGDVARGDMTRSSSRFASRSRRSPADVHATPTTTNRCSHHSPGRWGTAEARRFSKTAVGPAKRTPNSRRNGKRERQSACGACDARAPPHGAARATAPRSASTRRRRRSSPHPRSRLPRRSRRRCVRDSALRASHAPIATAPQTATRFAACRSGDVRHVRSAANSTRGAAIHRRP